MIGIVVACLAMVFLLVAALIIFIACRQRILGTKPPQTRRALADVRALQESGCGLPVDIPVEALTREPPPRYTSLDDLSTSSTSHRHDVSISVLPPPPPYSLQVYLPAFLCLTVCLCACVCLVNVYFFLFLLSLTYRFNTIILFVL